MNPRGSYKPPTRLAGERLRPLGHLSRLSSVLGPAQGTGLGHRPGRLRTAQTPRGRTSSDRQTITSARTFAHRANSQRSDLIRPADDHIGQDVCAPRKLPEVGPHPTGRRSHRPGRLRTAQTPRGRISSDRQTITSARTFAYRANSQRSDLIRPTRREWDLNPRDPRRAQRFSRPSPSTARSSLLGHPVVGGWRRGRDSNPRGANAPTAFRVPRTRPDYATPPGLHNVLRNRRPIPSRIFCTMCRRRRETTDAAQCAERRPERLAEGGGFEPPRGVNPNGISSAAH